ncbi:MAG: hypothetical protein BroJett018_29730 [Chloroflexota bacterium]|nr:MAG: hypothetical protein BroJett018_29730 [Chloroflexota bacterium]
MSKIDEARDILNQLGLPLAQQTEIAALTLLVLAQLTEDAEWPTAKTTSLRIHDILIEIKARFGRTYAENTRETVRRHVLHQLEQAGLVIRNPDDPTLATNSPRTHYALSELALDVLRKYQTAEWNTTLHRFRETQASLLETYLKRRQQDRIPLVYQGQEYHLSPGRHNALQVAVIEEFGPRFAPGARLIYLGDTEKKNLVLDESAFNALNVTLTSHDKLPDIVLYDEVRQWVFLVEAVSSHGPVSPKRFVELEQFFNSSTAGRIYVSAFPDFSTFKRFASEIAWETEVWISEIPDHLIHFNGDKFLGPR